MTDHRYSPTHIKALRHPVRLRIVEPYLQDENRSLAVRDLAAELGDRFDGVTLSQVSYHLRELQRVNLIPTPSPC